MFITHGICEGQNLVQNGNFEQFDTCPTFHSQLYRAQFWNSPTLATPDYFNTCATQFYITVPDT